jgi:hypothetical protein
MKLNVEGDRIVVTDDRARTVLIYHVPAPGTSASLTDFIHPLTLDGVPITEQAPVDHTHHRGIFWAWRRVLVGGVAADSWIGKDIAFETVDRRGEVTPDGARIETEGNWIVPKHHAGPCVRQRTTIAIADDDKARRLVVEIRLRALAADVALAGSDDEKGYGGPTLRFAHSDRIASFRGNRPLEPAPGAVETDATIDFRWRPQPAGFPALVRARAAVDDKPWTRWVLRRGPGMQNCAFPGRTPHPLPTTQDLAIQLTLELIRG